eukprot:gene5962-6657_t
MNTCYYCEIVLIVLFEIPRAESCTKNKDCGDNQCCALQLRLFGYKGYCFPMKSLGEVCTPSVKVGKHFTCGCSAGLTCAITAIDKFKNPKFRCVRIPTEAPELSEKVRRIRIHDEPSRESPFALKFSRYLENVLKRQKQAKKSPHAQS